MPIYEFRCNTCQQRSSFFSRTVSSTVAHTCPACGSDNLTRIISSFAYHKSEHNRQEEAGPPQAFPGPDYYKDPRNIGKWAEKRLTDMGIEMPSQVQEMIGRAREGDMSILEKQGL